MTTQALSDDETWLLSFYRTSEIAGALFFGRLAKSMKDPAIKEDMTKHFADESQHAWFWTKCLSDCDEKPITMGNTYQEQYLAAAGMPANLMEVLAITQVFERRVIGQYGLHSQSEKLHPAISATLSRIMEDEKWHIEWVSGALKAMEPEYGKAHIDDTIKRFRQADREVYEKMLTEQQQRMENLFGKQIFKKGMNYGFDV